MKYFILTFGCQMNYSDSEKIAAKLKRAGHQSAKTATAADLIVINACSVRQSAVHRVFGQVEKFRDKKIAVAGCLLPNDKKRLTADNIPFWYPDDYFNLTPLRQNKFSAFLPVMTGCNNFCSYCVVPFTRGREKSRPAKTIVAEIKSLLKKGAKEIILLGQNVNSYRDKKINFPRLLKTINNLPGNFWLTFITSHPKDMSDELITTMARCQKITPYIHLPIQSGDDKILRAMNRHYSVAHYKNLIKKLRLNFKKHRPAWPPLAISTDIIVGFPGETIKQFQNTLRLIKEIKFDMIYFARYSPRQDTAAAKLADSIPQCEKKRRAQAINQLLKQTATRLNKKYAGQAIKVLITSTDKDFAFGKTITNKDVKLPTEKLKCGDIIDAKIISTTAWGLKGHEK